MFPIFIVLVAKNELVAAFLHLSPFLEYNALACELMDEAYCIKLEVSNIFANP